MAERMLIGYGGEQGGRDAATFAAKLATVGSYALTIAYPFHPLLSTHAADTIEAPVRRQVEAILAGSGCLSTARYRWSNASWPVRALHELACFEGADLIVFGRAQGPPASLEPDLMARMVHGSPCAVAAVPEGYADRANAAVRRVGAGFVDTREGHAAAIMACVLAARAGGEVTLATGSASSTGVPGDVAGPPEPPRVEDGHHAAVAALERAADELGRPRRLRLIARDEQPADMLVDESEHLDLLVLGSRGLGPARRALLGSVSADVMRRAACPVLVIPRGVASSRRSASAELVVGAGV